MTAGFELPPYARAMGMLVLDRDAPGAPVVAMDFAEKSEGRPGYLHGGAIGGLLEMAGFAALDADLAQRGIEARFKPINISIEYLRNGLPERVFARGEVLRAGRRIANVRIEAWQGDSTAPIASCWMNFQLSPVKAA
jgi:uncharacterized protein (TIGR00369 family)